jgi:mycoredoxin
VVYLGLITFFTMEMQMEIDKETILFYGTPTCPMVPPVRGVLQRAGVPFTYVNISRNWAGKQVVRTINNGNESVPTLCFPDGSTMTEPPIGHLKKKLAEMGYKVQRPWPWQSLREHPIYTVLGLVGLLFGWWDGDQTLLIGGGVVLVLVIVWGFWRA